MYYGVQVVNAIHFSAEAFYSATSHIKPTRQRAATEC